MKLLVFTQIVDKDDPGLGFFHRWLGELSKHFESIIVICLKEGKHILPANVRILSLGKEQHQSRAQYLRRLYAYVWRERRNYDAVFVHMNQEYVLLCGLIWKLLGKKIYMWRNHYGGSWLTDKAAAFCTKVFCTSKYSYTAKYKKTTLMPVGVDTDFFKPDPTVKRVAGSIVSLGRISPSKRIDLLVEAFGLLKQKGASFTASIYGDALPKDAAFLETLKKRVVELGLGGQVKFYPGVPNDKTPAVYSAHEIFVNLSPSGMYDKTLFESAACGCTVVASNKDLLNVFGSDYVFEDDEAATIAAKLAKHLAGNQIKKTDLRKVTEGQHSLRLLGQRLEEELA